MKSILGTLMCVILVVPLQLVSGVLYAVLCLLDAITDKLLKIANKLQKTDDNSI